LKRSLRKRRNLLIVMAVIALIIISIVGILLYPGLPQTNAKAGFSATYDYVTTYGSAAYLNKFNIRVVSVTGNKVVFNYQQTISANSTANTSPVQNYSLAFDPASPNTYEAGSAMPLFVANYLKNSSGITSIIPVGTSLAVSVNYTTLISRDFVRVNFTYYSGPQSTAGTFIRWILNYNQTTGLLLNGLNVIVSTEVSYSTYNFTLTSFSR
jgi:type II secretory pathway pseudopilin PulG